MKLFVTICHDGDGYPCISRIALNPHKLRKTKDYEDSAVCYCELDKDGCIDCVEEEIEHWKEHKF